MLFMDTEEEQRKRDQAYMRAAESFRRFSPEETLIFGLRLSSISLRIVEDLVKRTIENES